MVFVVTATRIEQPLDTVGTTVSVVELASDPGAADSSPPATSCARCPACRSRRAARRAIRPTCRFAARAPSQTLILIDGVEVNTGATGGFDLADLTTDNLDRIEVVRGAGGSLYGSQAIGGVVNLITQEGSGPPSSATTARAATARTQRQVGDLRRRGRAIWRTRARCRTFRPTAFRPRNDSSDNLSAHLRLDYHLDADTRFTRLRALHPLEREPGQLLRTFLRRSTRTPISATSSCSSTASSTHHFGESAGAANSVFFVRNDLRLNDDAVLRQSRSLRARSRSRRDSRRTNHGVASTDGARAFARWSASISRIAGCARTASSFDDLRRRPRSRSPLFHARRQEYAGYLEQEGSCSTAMMLVTGGFRVDGNSQFGKEVSPSWSVAIPLERKASTPARQLQRRLSRAQLQRAVLPRLRQSESEAGDFQRIGRRYSPTPSASAASLTATYFSRRVHSLIVAEPCTAFPGCVEAGNAGARRHAGRRNRPEPHN